MDLKCGSLHGCHWVFVKESIWTDAINLHIDHAGGEND